MSAVVLGPADGLSRGLADKLRGTVAEPEQALPPHITSAVVVAGTHPPPRLADAATLSGADWDRTVDGMMWSALAALQRARSAFNSDGGRIVVVVPTIGMAGAAQLLAYTTALEGIRAMAKSAARQWQPEGVPVNLVAAPLRLFAPSVDASAAHLAAAVVQDDSTLLHSVAEAVAFLLRPDLHHLLGETIVVDGGSVMLP
ncbi:SDR family oxidoreductase [Mycobacterium mantenii]|uniref:SDR family oxidoreductase n=1 Tax=Mycobacterium mantenii TaxID=560555 RepID=UPI000AC7A25E|nr:SDR family oxidoreductase [Mycobacterium mantenii]